jgi:hypothetical protein
MHIDHFIPNLEKRSGKNGLEIYLGETAIDSAITAFEERNAIIIPEQVMWFYQKCNGLKVEAPPLDIKPIEDLHIDEAGKIIFSVFDEQHRLCFDTSKINDASQWNILNYDTGFLVTLTMASFWTNKVFDWLDKKRTIWKEETY